MSAEPVDMTDPSGTLQALAEAILTCPCGQYSCPQCEMWAKLLFDKQIFLMSEDEAA